MGFKKRKLGRTGLTVSPFAVGGGYGALPYVFDRAHEAGVNVFFYSSFFPTYIPMVFWLRSVLPVKRDNLVLITATYLWRLKGSLKRVIDRHLLMLKTDYIDIFLLGWTKSINQDRAFDELKRIKEKGKIKFIGVSVHNRSLIPGIIEKYDVDVVMTRYNIAHRGAESDVYPYVKDQGVIAFNALKHGRVIKKKKGWDESKGKFPTASEAYRFVLSNKNVHLCLAGPRLLSHIEEIKEAMEKGPLDEERIRELCLVGDFIHR